MTDGTLPTRPASYDKKVGLVLQGGGALGSYQAGVYEALSGSEYTPDWIAGISIDAINAAIIAGNAPNDRVDRLRSFWEAITAPTMLWPNATGALATWQRWTGVVMVAFGQPGFFSPNAQTWLPFERVSFYSTSALKATLERLVDFDRINDGKEMRLSVGAVNVETSKFAYFDNREMKIRPEHVMASGALPPGFPSVEVDGEGYWDGGLVSNTPLQYMVDYVPRHSRVIFQVDLFPARARRRPRTLDEVHDIAQLLKQMCYFTVWEIYKHETHPDKTGVIKQIGHARVFWKEYAIHYIDGKYIDIHRLANPERL
jgi:NTE family protein